MSTFKVTRPDGTQVVLENFGFGKYDACNQVRVADLGRKYIDMSGVDVAASRDIENGVMLKYLSDGAIYSAVRI